MLNSALFRCYTQFNSFNIVSAQSHKRWMNGTILHVFRCHPRFYWNWKVGRQKSLSRINFVFVTRFSWIQSVIAVWIVFINWDRSHETYEWVYTMTIYSSIQAKRSYAKPNQVMWCTNILRANRIFRGKKTLFSCLYEDNNVENDKEREGSKKGDWVIVDEWISKRGLENPLSIESQWKHFESVFGASDYAIRRTHHIWALIPFDSCTQIRFHSNKTKIHSTLFLHSLTHTHTLTER